MTWTHENRLAAEFLSGYAVVVDVTFYLCFELEL
jgi:hypothetical protein